MISAAYSAKAQINFGIISTCVCVQTPLNCIAGLLFFNEKLTFKVIVGTTMVLAGVIWIAMARGADAGMQVDVLSEQEKNTYKWLAIFASLLSGVITAIRTLQAKYVSHKYNYSPFDFSVDSGLIIGVGCLLCASVFYLQGTPTYTLYNSLMSIASSVIAMMINVVGLNCIVKGLAGPTSAIFQSSVIVTVTLNAMFLAQIPTVEQVLAAALTIAGVLVMILAK